MKKGISVEELQRIFVNPFYAINIDPTLCAEHEPMVDKKTWIEANLREIEETSPKEWLEKLLDVLEGNYV